MSDIRSYRDLDVWRRSKALAISIYKVTEDFPKNEIYGLTSQIRRAAVSVPSNVAEGFRRNSDKEKLQFLHIAFGSGAELETQIEISKDLNYLDKDKYSKIFGELEEIMKMLNSIINNFDKANRV